MPEKIFEPEGLWEFVCNNAQSLEEQIEIGNYPDVGIIIYVGKNKETDTYQITVEADDVIVYEEDFFGETDCEDTCKRVFHRFLTNEVYKEFFARGKEREENEEDEEDEEDGIFPLGYRDLIEEREDEIDIAVEDLFYTILNNCASDPLLPVDQDRLIKDMKEHILEYMARKHGLDIYRPMILVKLNDKGEEKEGSEYYSDFPYGDLFPDAEIY